MTEAVITEKKRGRKRAAPSELNKELGPGDEVDVDKKTGTRGFKWENQQYHLTYRGWIPLEVLQDTVKAGFPNSSFVAFSMVHEKADELNPYEHTHWYFKLDKKGGSRGARLLDVGDVHPHVRKVFAYGDHGAYLMDSYHMKEKDAWRVQFGRENLKSAGQREREIAEDITRLASEGKLKEISELYPGHYHRWHRSITSVASARGIVDVPDVSPLKQVDNHWWYGPPNTCKSTLAKEYLRGLYGEEPYVMSASTRWVDGFKHQKGFIIEETCPSSCVGRSAFFKQLLDVFPVRVECKGSSLEIRPVTIIVTSNYHPEACFNAIDAAAIVARVALRHFDKAVSVRKAYNETALESLNAFVDRRLAEISNQ